MAYADNPDINTHLELFFLASLKALKTLRDDPEILRPIERAFKKDSAKSAS